MIVSIQSHKFQRGVSARDTSIKRNDLSIWLIRSLYALEVVEASKE